MSRAPIRRGTSRLIAECVAIPAVALVLAVSAVCWWCP
jgi:hypothetical protein